MDCSEKIDIFCHIMPPKYKEALLKKTSSPSYYLDTTRKLPMAAHMFVLYFGMMSMITPPVALAAFAASTLSGADPMRTGFSAMRFGWLAFVIPFMFVFSPTLLMQGTPLLIAFNFITALIGTCLISMAVVGYFFRRLGPVNRLFFAAAGLAAIFPATGHQLSLFVNAVGLLAAALAVGREFLWRQRFLPPENP